MIKTELQASVVIVAYLTGCYRLTRVQKSLILRHNNILNRYLPALLYLPSTPPFYASVSKGAASTIFLHLWYGAAV